ncbi:MAG: hypothetical protein QOJ00_2368 [Actinomycetota bacterium]|jgi:multisubunit Na+/H+ antiporter MnhC subunit
MHPLLLAAAKSTEGGGVNVLPIALVLIAIVIGFVVWKRRSAR